MHSRTNGALREITAEIQRLGIALCEAGDYRRAAFQFRKALAMEPGFSDAALGLGHCLQMQGNHEEALSVYDQALMHSSASSALWNNRGNALLEMGRFAEAAESYARALELSPSLHDTRVALATCFQALGRVEEAMASCEAVLAADPEHAEAHWNRSLLLLLKGKYREGWREYEWRWRKRNFTSPSRDFPRPLWRGEDPAGRTILIHAEQGFGDTLQFCRYVPLVAAAGARVIFECHPPLAGLMRSLAGDVRVVSMGQPLPDFDLHVPLMSLPLVFGTTIDTIPAATPYLHPAKDRPPFRFVPVDAGARFRVGLCWSGKGYPDPRRSCPVELLTPLDELGGITWFSLQVGWKGDLPITMTDHTAQLQDFADTAALIAQLDLVITIDTSVAHLAGAMGKETWVMLPAAPDWRWMLNRDDSPWYPSMKLFRQERPLEWGEVIRGITRSLETGFSRTSR